MKKHWISPCFDDTEIVRKKSKHVTENIPVVENSNFEKNTSTVTWIDKYKPKNLNDLVIHSKKVEELQSWFNRYKKDPYSCKYLLLFGPSGCGKTVLTHVISKSNCIQVLEWITPLDRDYDFNSYDGQEYRSVLQTFKTFLLQASRYPTLLSEFSLKIILVKDFPNIFLHNPLSFHEVLVNFYQVKSHPVIFICNNESITRKLFPNDVREKCAIETINFNPIHCKAVITALKRIIALENKVNKISIQTSHLENIYHQTGGDLRSAILKLYFNFVKLENNIGVIENRKPNVQKEKVTDKDENCDLFVGLGRVLYSKRDVVNQHEKQYKFVHEPSNIADSFLSETGNFVNFLQENYLSRFSNIKDVAIAAEQFSTTDCLCSYRNYNEEVDKIILEIICRGLMTANSCPVKQFKPFVKPSSYKIKLRKEILDETRLVFPKLGNHSSSDIILYVLPFLKKIMFNLNNEQNNYIITNSFK